MYSARLTPPSSRGFSLFELLAVIAIIAVLTGLVVPMMGGSPSRDAAANAGQLVMMINQAREESVMSSRIWQVELDPQAHSYRFLIHSGDGFAGVDMRPLAGEHRLGGSSLDRIEINGEPLSEAGQVYLFPTGEQDSFRLIVRGGGNEYAVEMDPVGEARLVEL